MSRVITTLLLLAGLASGAFGQNRLDFEDAASYTGDNGVIPAEYFQSRGFSFTARAGADAATATDVTFAFEEVGVDGQDAFWTNNQAARDNAIAGDLGNYFLKAGTGNLSYNKAKYFKLDIDYTEPAHRARAEIWVIDGPEQYQVTAYDTTGSSVGTLTSPVGRLDGKSWFWRFQTSGDQRIASIEIEAIGTKTLRGFAFDNFEAHPGPVPAALPLGVAGLGQLAFKRRRERRKERRRREAQTLTEL